MRSASKNVVVFGGALALGISLPYLGDARIRRLDARADALIDSINQCIRAIDSEEDPTVLKRIRADLHRYYRQLWNLYVHVSPECFERVQAALPNPEDYL